MAKDTLLTYTTSLFGTPTADSGWGTATLTGPDEYRALTFAGTPAKVLVVSRDVSTHEILSYELDGNTWTMPRGMFFRQYLPGYMTRRNTLLTILLFVVTALVTGLFYSGAIRLPSMPTLPSIGSWLTPSAPATTTTTTTTTTPATGAPASSAPAPTVPVAIPTSTAPAPITVNLPAPVVSPQDAASLALLGEEQQELLDTYGKANDKLTDIRALIDAKKFEYDRAEKSVDYWQEQYDDATDDDVKEMAMAKLNAAKLEVNLRKKELTKLQQKEADALVVVKKLRSQNRKLLSRTPDTESDAALAALVDEVKSLTKAVKTGNTEVATAVNGVSSKVGELKKPLEEISASVDKLTAEVKKQNERLDVAFKNIMALDAMNKETATKLAETLNKIEAKKAVNAADPETLKRMADALEATLKKLSESPAPAAPAAPVTAPAYTQPQVQQGQYYAAPCQGNQCQGRWSVRRN